MSSGRLSSSQSNANTHRSEDKDLLKIERFIGISLGGAKSETTTSLVVLDHYVNQKKIFATHIYENVRGHDEVSSDSVLLEIIKEHSEYLSMVSFDVPLSFPFCIDCKCKAMSVQECNQPEVVYMRKIFSRSKKKRGKIKMFTPYTQRACEIYLSHEVDCDLQGVETLGANYAPLTARVQFLLKRLKKIKVIETFPRLSVLRVGKALKIAASHLKHYRHAMGGDESRQIFLQQLVKRDVVFFYQSDFGKLVENPHSFDAFVAAFTAFLKKGGQCEKPPKDFPNKTGWIDFPIEALEFD